MRCAKECAATCASPIAPCWAISATRPAIISGTGWCATMRPARRLPRPVRRRARRLCAGAADALQRRRAGRLAERLCQRLCHRASLGGFRRDLGALSAHRRHAGDRARFRPVDAPRAGARRRSTPASISIPIARPAWSTLIDAWLPLSFALNSLNRAMGLSDLYPFVLSPPAIEKLGFVHEIVHAI